MQLELIKDHIYCKIFDLTDKGTTGIYNKYRANKPETLAEIQRNLNYVTNALQVQELITLNQVHGSDLVHIEQYQQNFTPEADGVITNLPKIALGILTADCVPVLLYSTDTIAALHCGWRSARQGIIGKACNSLRKLNPLQPIQAVIGPAIAQASYEVDNNYRQNFIDFDQASARFFTATSNKPNHWQFDLVAYVKHQLLIHNVEVTSHFTEDTYANPEKYPSYRRHIHYNLPYRQNILSTIFIK